MAFALPDKFSIYEHIISPFSNASSLADNDGQPLARTQRDVFSLRTTYRLKSNDGLDQAVGRQALFSLGKKVWVEDAQGERIGHFQASLLTLLPEYTLYDATGKAIGIAQKNFNSTELTVYASGETEPCATLSRPFLHLLSDRWTAEILKDSVDPRLLTLLALFETNADNITRSENQANSKSFLDALLVSVIRPIHLGGLIPVATLTAVVVAAILAA